MQKNVEACWEAGNGGSPVRSARCERPTAPAGDCGAICREGAACDVLQIDRSTVRYLSRRGDDMELRDAIKRVSRERRRFGCRRIHVMIAR